MNSRIRQLLHDYARRRSPWGPPWWIYGVAFGVANLIRQVVIVVSPAEIPQSIRVASWVATALLVIAVINVVAVALRRRDDHAQPGNVRALTPFWPLRPDRQIANSPAASPKEDTVMNQQVQQQPTTSTRWAPWWVYFVIIVGANYLRRALLPDGGTPALRVVIALALSAVLFAAITIIYRSIVRNHETCMT